MFPNFSSIRDCFLIVSRFIDSVPSVTVSCNQSQTPRRKFHKVKKRGRFTQLTKNWKERRGKKKKESYSTWLCARPGGTRCPRWAAGPWRSSRCTGCWAAARAPCPVLSARAAGARGPPYCLFVHYGTALMHSMSLGSCVLWKAKWVSCSILLRVAEAHTDK